MHKTHIPPSCDCVCIEVLGNPSELVLSSGVMSSHGGLLMVLPQGELKSLLIMYDQVHFWSWKQ